MGKIDLILQRLTSISQIALVIIAVFTIWYSVIPLYQKELASEQLAKIQIDQLAAEERLNFLNASYTTQLKEVESARSEVSLLTEKLANDRDRLDILKEEIDKKNNQLIRLRATLDKEKIRTLSASNQLTQSQKLKFIQALDWYTLTAPLDEKCATALRRWTRPDSPKNEEIKKVGCAPYENIKAAISKIQLDTAKDSSGDDLKIERANLELWSRQAYSLMEKNKYQLSDQMDYAYRDKLLSESEKDITKGLSQSEASEELKKSLEAGKELINYEYKIKSKNRGVVSWYIKLLRETL
ncbi:hypothetical protein [Pseudomonas sp. S09G 359]|uniref:hypothetical protein n=1 Tax=Pseudomonas sp. S09G 359 TaxID=2054919 RepID=UPI000C6DC827|nr:hypothetical protein [Pseudomonas sp. S09G 359]AUG05220.1 hypothetical protein CXQ82_00990 [Pseudomonas sp. S09G 359]